MQTIRDGLEFCETCMVITINGYDDNSTEAEDKACSEGLTRLGPHVVPDFDTETGRGYDEFKTTPCACCQSRLYGARYDFAIIA